MSKFMRRAWRGLNLERITVSRALALAFGAWVAAATLEVATSLDLTPEANATLINVINGGKYAPASGGGGGALTCATAEDLAEIDWHEDSGAWGDADPIVCAELPTTTSTQTCTSFSECQSEIEIDGVQLTIDADWGPSNVLTIDDNAGDGVHDIDVIVLSTSAIGTIQLGSFGCTQPHDDIRIRGSTPGSYSGGIVGQLRIDQCVTDLTIDGIATNGDTTGASGYSGAEGYHCFHTDGARLTVLNVLALCAAHAWIGSATDVVINNSSFMAGAATTTEVGYVEGWGIRNSHGKITIIDSDIRTTRYVPLRTHSTNGGSTTDELMFVLRSILLNYAEARTAWEYPDANGAVGGLLGPGLGAVIQDSHIYAFADSDCGLGAQIDIATSYSRHDGNTFYEIDDANNSMDFSQSWLDGEQATAASNWGGTHTDTGNTFTTAAAAPAWGGAGDPTTLPMANGMTLQYAGQGNCGAIP
jgi:hypothetical protein